MKLTNAGGPLPPGMKVVGCPRVGVHLAMIARTKEFLIELRSDRQPAGPGDVVARSVTVKGPNWHVVAVGATASEATAAGRCWLARNGGKAC